MLGVTNLQMAKCTGFTKSFLTLNIPYGFTFDILPEHNYGPSCTDFQETRTLFAILRICRHHDTEFHESRH